MGATLKMVSVFLEKFLAPRFVELLMTPVGLLCIILSLALFAFSILGLISSIKRKEHGNMLAGTSVIVAFIGFLSLAILALPPLSSIGVKSVFCVVFGVGNMLLWPRIILRLGDASNKKEASCFWFPLSILPVISLWIVAYITHVISPA